MTRPSWRRAALCVLAPAILAVATARGADTASQVYRSPIALAYSGDGKTLAVADHTAGSVAFVDAAKGVVTRRTAASAPWGLAWSGARVYAAEHGTGSIVEIDPASARAVRRMRVGVYPRDIAVAPKRRVLLCANSGTRDVSVVDLATGKEGVRLPIGGEPGAIAVSPDESVAVVTTLIPTGDATRETNAAAVSIFDLTSRKRTALIALPSGSVVLRGAAITPDGRWACIAHCLGRFNLPTTQLDRGWVNTNALSIIDLRARKHYATVLLDHPQEGAADPWGLAMSRDGSRLWVSLSGVHEVARIDFAGMMKLIAGGLPDDSPLAKHSDEWAATMRNVWQDIKADPARREDLVNDLAALHLADLIERVRLPGNGPRGIAVAPDGSGLAVAQYYAGRVALTDPKCGSPRFVSMGPSRTPAAARKGEIIFHDATYCFQHWLSCATCHPGGRADGLNWDLLNDGIGNPKNTRSLLLAHRRGLMMAHGIRSDFTVATRAGFRFILFREPEKGETETVQAYIRSMKPEPSPHRVRLPDGRLGGLSASALAGKAIFASARTQCTKCHNGELHTDKKVHRVGTRGPYDSGDAFVTPTLVEVWRSAPYLHDGRATTMTDVLTKFNKNNLHGVTSHLSGKQIRDLAEYVLSL